MKCKEEGHYLSEESNNMREFSLKDRKEEEKKKKIIM